EPAGGHRGVEYAAGLGAAVHAAFTAGRYTHSTAERRSMSHSFDYHLVCIGSGPAGQRAAIQASKLGKRAAVIEKQRSAGGICIDTGTIPSKTFREAVRRVYSRPGLEAGDAAQRDRMRPTMEQLFGHVAHVIRRESGTVHDVLTRNDIRLIHGRAAF